ncbi:hypothetical protein KS4_16080 [Poriferisphaera corsica]|uniref:Uncharacterized protein n=1 Tax=Poriferisphaera corsica TaxID=2528020 RepID=A0A517YTK5_9BACT|nr:hypothetical protein [Poriferisphaera corsica]QDU33557.1 hypothetical protein KS4_16080 [Poriferisphaera corsica]
MTKNPSYIEQIVQKSMDDLNGTNLNVFQRYEKTRSSIENCKQTLTHLEKCEQELESETVWTLCNCRNKPIETTIKTSLYQIQHLFATKNEAISACIEKAKSARRMGIRSKIAEAKETKEYCDQQIRDLEEMRST